MKIQRGLLLILVCLAALAAEAQVYLRYNYVGYNPLRKKRMVIMAEEDVAGSKWTIKNEKGKGVMDGVLGASLYGKGDNTPMPFNYVVDFSTLQAEGTYVFEIKGAEKADIIIKKNPYGPMLEKPLHWMRAARCGSIHTVDHGACHFGDTSSIIYRRVGIRNSEWVESKEKKKVNVVGGWHDAGDYIKFTLTTAYAAYFLLRSYEVNPEVFEKKMSKTEYVDILDEAKWALDYLMRCMPDTNEFIIMTGGNEDHNVGCRLPTDDELDGKRQCFSALSPTQMGYTVAALALGSQIFGGLGKTKIAQGYQNMAELVFRRAISKDAVAPAWYTAEFHFYSDQTMNDNLELGAIELYRLTKNEMYLEKAKAFSDLARSAGWRAWESVNMPAHMKLMEFYSVVKNDLHVDLEGFLNTSRKRGNLWGLPIKYVWSGLYSYIGIGASAMEYELRTKRKTYESMGLNMLDYLLGLNNWGVCFVATPEIKNSIRNPYSQIYNLQADLFPLGAISEGPGDKHSHDENRVWFGYDLKAQPTHKFNTDKGVFYDHHKDFMCMETTICGVSDGIYILALASKMYRD